jgi:hypothetical protein
MPNKRKAKNPIITTGLAWQLERLKLDRRTKAAKALEAARNSLAALFPGELNAAAEILIDRIVFKALKLSIFERLAIKGHVSPNGEETYIRLSNSLRDDLRLLMALADRKAPSEAPDLNQYLKALRESSIDVTPGAET